MSLGTAETNLASHYSGIAAIIGVQPIRSEWEMKSLWIFVACGIVAGPAMAQNPTGASASEAAGKASDVNKVVCKREESIGSRLAAKKVCLTVQEWTERERISKDATERWQQSAGVGTSN